MNSKPPRRGRPAKGPVPMTSAEKSRQYRQRLHAARDAHVEIGSLTRMALVALAQGDTAHAGELLARIKDLAELHRP